MNQKPYNKRLSINLVWSVCTGKYLPEVLALYENPSQIFSLTDLVLGT